METLRKKLPIQRSSDQQFYLSCPAEFEGHLLEEIKEVISIENLKISEIIGQKGGFYLNTSFSEIIKLSLNLRTASKIYWIAFKFNIKHENEIYKKALQLNWEALLTPDLTIKIDTQLDSLSKTRFKNSHYLSLKLKDAVVDYFRNKTNKRPNVELKNPDIKLLYKIINKTNFSQTLILVDMFGEPLSNRGYRIRGHEAPLRENLAATIVKKIAPQKNSLVVDTMCGSATFLIESFLYANNICPKYLRIKTFLNDSTIWSFAKFPLLKRDSSQLREIKRYCQLISERDHTNLNNAEKNQYIGYDKSERSVALARETLQKALLDQFITIKKMDATSLGPIAGPGIVFCNPPYGERLGDIQELESLYFEYGENLKNNFKNFDAWVFTGEPELRKKISLRTNQRVKLFNGPIECRLLQYKLY